MADSVIGRLSATESEYLIDLYHSQECLWNVMSQNYKNRIHRAAAYKKIQENFKTSTNIMLSGKLNTRGALTPLLTLLLPVIHCRQL